MHISQNVKLLPKVSTSPHLHILPAKPNPNLSSCQFKGIMHLYVALGHISNEGGGCLIKCIMLVQFFFFFMITEYKYRRAIFIPLGCGSPGVCVCGQMRVYKVKPLEWTTLITHMQTPTQHQFTGMSRRALLLCAFFMVFAFSPNVEHW